MKKLLLIAIVAAGFLVAGAPKSEARVFFNIGIGLPLPVAYYPGYYPYGYYPYGAPYYSPGVYYGVGYRPYYRWHGRRVYYRHRCW